MCENPVAPREIYRIYSKSSKSVSWYYLVAATSGGWHYSSAGTDKLTVRAVIKFVISMTKN